MTGLFLHCFGSFEATFNGVVISGFPTDKIRALLAYLAVESGQPHRRETLAGIFWPELPQATAMTNLRVAFYRLRQTLERASPEVGVALNPSTRHALQLDQTAVTVDVTLSRALLAACAWHDHGDLHACDECLPRLLQATDLYRGEFLAGFGLEDAPAFEEWLFLSRENIHQQMMAAFHALVAAYEWRGNKAQAHLVASRQLALDPLREQSHRQLMRVLAGRGLQSEALLQFESCRRLLNAELGVEPAAETLALVDQIRTGTLIEHGGKAGDDRQEERATLTPNTLTPSGVQPAADLGGTPEIAKLYGRQSELAHLHHWLVQDRCRLVAILGMGGVGKTTLAAAAARAAGEYFDCVLWRSLLNAPPPEELLRELLHTLDNRQLFDLPASLDQQLALLIEQFRRQRCLLILDNLESILLPEWPGQMRHGYEAYAQLIRLIIESSHQSTLLITSRERPLGLARSEEDTPLVRTLLLYGLAEASGQAMLAARGISGPNAVTSLLVQRYSGNPLALKLLAQSVQELFGGDVAAFLEVEAPIFDDIRTLIAHQFGRLTGLEQELLIWLAIEREPMTLQMLRANMVQPGVVRATLEALSALRRRSMVEQSEEGFVLQNVVTEFLTDFLVERFYHEIAVEGVIRWPEGRMMDLRPHLTVGSLLNKFALIKATAKEYVRASQERLILQPIAQRLLEHFKHKHLVAGRLQEFLAALRVEPPTPGYAAGNILNLLLHLGIDVRGYDFSGLNVWQAFLQGKQLPEVNFSGANLSHSLFTHAFGDVLGIEFTASGQLLVASLNQDKLCLWRVQIRGAARGADEELSQTFQTPAVGTALVAFSRGGRLLATGDTDFRVRVWDVEGGQLLYTLPEHARSPWAVTFSADEQWLASSGGDGAIYLWNLQTGELEQIFEGHQTGVPALAFTPDGQLLASGDVDGLVCVWERAARGNPQPRHKFHDHNEEVHALLFDESRRVLASGSHDRTVRLWDVESGKCTHTLQGHTHVIRAFALSPDGHTLASAGSDSIVCLWDMHTGQLLHTLLTQGYYESALAFSADGQILASVGTTHMICLWEVASGQRLDSLQMNSKQTLTVDFSPDGRFVASGGKDMMVRLWDVSNDVNSGGRLAQTLYGHTRWIRAISFQPTGILLASGGCDNLIRLWETTSGRMLRLLAGHSDHVESLHFSPDGQLLVSASRDTTLRVWNVQSGQTLATLHGHTNRIYTCAFSADGRHVASGGADRMVYIWDLQAPAGRQLLHALRGHTNGVRAVAYSPHGEILVSASFDHTIKVWDPHSGKLLDSHSIQNAIIVSIAFHPNGNWLALGSSDHSVRLWDLQSGRVLCTLRGHTNSVETLRFSPDGEWLASAGYDETIRVWETSAALTAPAGIDSMGTGFFCYILRADGPYAGMNIVGIEGISAAQKAALIALGAREA